MKHYLTYKDDKSDKFWQIEVNGSSFTVTYGKTGTTGTSQTKTFESDEKCLKEAEKLVAEKKKKGYTLDDSSKPVVSPPNTSSNLSDAFFSYLKTEVSNMDDNKIASRLQKAKWNTYATHTYNCLISHWDRLAKEIEMPIGAIIIGWNDGGDNGIDIDYVENNDEVGFYSDGATENFASEVINFDNFFKEVLKSSAEEIQDEDFFEVVKNLLCKMTQEQVIRSIDHQEFQKIPKHELHRIWFYYWHDEDMVEIFNSSKRNLPIANSIQSNKADETIPPVKSFYKFFQIKITGTIPPNIAKASKAFNAVIDTPDENLSKGFAKLVDLTSLEIVLTKASVFPNEILALTKLENFEFEADFVSEIPNDIGNLTHLQKLIIRKTKIETLPTGVGKLTALRRLLLIGNRSLKRLPAEIGQLEDLRDLTISDCDIDELNEAVYLLPNLEWLTLSRTSIKGLSESIAALTSLDTLWLNNTNVSSLPESIFKLKKMKTINLQGAKFTQQTADEISERFKALGKDVNIIM